MLFINSNCNRISGLIRSIFVFIVVFSANHQISDSTGTMATICGNRSRDVFVSRSNVMYVHFHSDHILNGYGFDAYYQEVEGKGRLCCIGHCFLKFSLIYTCQKS